MAAKQRDKLSKSLFEDDDLLDSLFEDKKPSVRGRAARGGPLTRSSATENIFSMLAEEVKKDVGDTEDLDDMDAELFASIKKPSSAPAQTKAFGTKVPKNDSTALEHSDEPVKKPNSAPAASTRDYRKFSFSEDDDPLADLLDDLLPDETKPEAKASVQPPKPEQSLQSPSASPNFKNRTSKTPANATSDDDKDDLMDALGFDSDQNNPRKKETSLWPNKERSEPPQRARTRLDEILESLPSPRLLERPPTGERKEQPVSRERQQQEKTTGAEEQRLDEDLTFGSYQPTLGSVPEGRQSRRPSVRFSTEDVSVSTTDKKPKPTTPTSALHRNSADWLGLTTKDDNTFLEEETKTSTGSPNAPSSPLLERKPSLTGGQATSTARKAVESPAPAKQTKPEFSTTQKKEEEDDWLAGVLSRKKTVSASNPESKKSKQEDSSDEGEEFDLESFVSKPVTSRAPRGREDNVASVKETSPAAHTTPVREETAEQVPQQNKMPNTSTTVQQQLTFSADNLQQILQQQQMMQSQLLSFGGVVDAGVQQRLVDKEHQPGGFSALQVRIIQLEGQVKTLQLERDQSKMTLESVQQQHNQDMELMENTHKARVKLLEESAAQREMRARQDYEDLMERLATVTRSAEQERSELQALYQRKLAQAQQERDREVERLRDLQRKSVSEMKKDHEDQVQRLKRLKDEEIDAVTSATSQTRSLTVVIEQMEQFSSRLVELSSRVESTHEHTAHGLEQGERHRDEQRRIMQDRLAQQQKAMADERTYLKEIISRMDTQLNEQQRQLEKERWKVTGEQAKVESTQRGLEEERRSLTMQMNMEREELERAKSALLEEQKSVMQHCAEERRKLAAEWSHFHAHEKQRHDRAEREVGSLLEKREDSILGLAQEQANLKLLTADVRQKEIAVAQERETLERLREELDREKDKICSTGLRLQSRAQEVEAFSKLAAERYEEGERALQEAQRVEAEHGARLGYIQTQTERLRKQEQRILQERMRLNLVQKKTERQGEEPHVTSLQPIPPILPESLMPNPELSSTLSTPPPISNTQPMMLQASLALWKYTAEKDRAYLHEENLFLENLKKNRSINSDWTMRTGHLQ